MRLRVRKMVFWEERQEMFQRHLPKQTEQETANRRGSGC
jgi:hypothetical protein